MLSLNRSYFVAYVFVILIISYLGGVLLYRRTSPETSVALLKLVDERVFLGTELPIWKILLPLIILIGMILFFATHRWLAPLTLLVGTGKTVYFGFTSGFLIEQQGSIVPYAIWWFPFQLMVSLLLILFCLVIAPPFFIHRNFDYNQKKVLIVIAVFAIGISLIETVVYRLVVL